MSVKIPSGSVRTYKVFDLFGNEELRIVECKKQYDPDLFSDYDSFVEKFEEKKTTDDCYTPPDVFAIVLDYVGENCDIGGRQVVRPFYPGGDFENIDYPSECVVIDNPPFSIISKIAKFYINRKIDFFLFAPHLTLFSSDIDCTHIVCGGNITYENGAVVKTSFISNMFGDAKVIGAADLLDRFKAYNKANAAPRPIYQYPDQILTVSMVQWIIDRGIPFRLDKGSVKHCRVLDDQKKHKKVIFGSGFLISEKAAAEKAAAEKAADTSNEVIKFRLSERETAIVKALK